MKRQLSAYAYVEWDPLGLTPDYILIQGRGYDGDVTLTFREAELLEEFLSDARREWERRRESPQASGGRGDSGEVKG